MTSFFIDLLTFREYKGKKCWGYGNCQNKELVVLTRGNKKEYWCEKCLKRALKEGYIKLNFNFHGLKEAGF